MTRRHALAIVAVLGTHASADPARVALDIDSCTERDEIRRIVAIELGAPLSDSPVGDETRAAITCVDGSAALRVEDAKAHRVKTRSLELVSAMPQARARLMSLAIVELISAIRTEPQDSVAPAPAASASVPVVLDTAVAEPAAPTLRLFALGGGELVSRTGVLGGGGLRVSRDLGATLGLIVDAQAHRGSRTVSLGRVSTDVLDLGALAGRRIGWSRTTLFVGAGIRAGTARLDGMPVDASVSGSKFWAPWLGACAIGSVDVAVTRSLALDLSVDGGYVLVPVGGLVGDRRETAVDGALIGVHIGIGAIL